MRENQQPAILLALVFVFGIILTGTSPARASVLKRGSNFALVKAPNACVTGTHSDGALYQICMPFRIFWNGDLFIYAHGYVEPDQPLALPSETEDVGSDLNLLGYAFATTSYSENGLAVRQAMVDIFDLIDVFTARYGPPKRIFLGGASEGGLITTLMVENHPDVFAGGLAMCGPYGDFRKEIDHIGDFRAVFDVYFPGLLPPSPVDIPQDLFDNWDAEYEATVKPAVMASENETALAQTLQVLEIDFEPTNIYTREQTVQQLLRYNVKATDDANLKLGGQPFDNLQRVYTGSLDDAALNALVERFSADPAALEEIEAYYQTTGQLSVPLVTMHTTGDPLVPYWHVGLYTAKTIQADNIALHQHIKVERYGHCEFTDDEIFDAVMFVVDLADNLPPYQPPQVVYLPLVYR